MSIDFYFQQKHNKGTSMYQNGHKSQITKKENNEQKILLTNSYLPTPLLAEPMVFPPSRERLPSGNM